MTKAERRIFKSLLSAEDAEKKLREYFDPNPIGVEEVPILEAFGRVLAEDVVSHIDVPGFDRALMDGYAVRAADTFAANEDESVKLKVLGSIEPGQKPMVTVNPGEAVEISTGAPVPKGANSVVMVEYTQQVVDIVQVYRAVGPGENVMPAGGDIMMGELVLRKGQRISSRELGLAAALGLRTLNVYRKPVVAIISTGDEIVPPGISLDYGKIYDINAATLAGAVAESSASPVVLGVAPDDPEKIKALVNVALQKADLILTSGSTSAGAGDLMYRVIDEMGSPGIIVHGLTVKPGKPTIIAVLNGKPVIGLPGYPTSALMMFGLLVKPLLLRMAGVSLDEGLPTVLGTVAAKIFSAKGRRELLPVYLIKRQNGEFAVYPVQSGSGAISSVAMADGYVDIPEENEIIDPGEQVLVELFNKNLQIADLTIIGSHDIGLDVMAQLLGKAGTATSIKIVNVGSLAGLLAVKDGQADLAGIHLLDEMTGEYNLPFLSRYGLDGKAALVRGYKREQGILTAPGNPNDVHGLKDLLREDVAFINRNPGSGTRILFDLKLKELAASLGSSFPELKSKIKGYDIESKSHSAVAAAVAHGRADAGIAIKAVAAAYGLDFIPLAHEQYDFVVPIPQLEKEAVRAFIKTLGSSEFRDLLRSRAPGLEPTSETGRILTEWHSPELSRNLDREAFKSVHAQP